MPKQERYSTSYPGVYYIIGNRLGARSKNEKEKIFYITYRKGNKQIHEKAGRQYSDDMTPARASELRIRRISGKEVSNRERRELERKIKDDKLREHTINSLWEQYKKVKGKIKGIRTDENRFKKHIAPIFGGYSPDKITSLQVTQFRSNLSELKKPGTVKNVLELLRRIINFGIENGLCTGPGFKIKLDKVNNEVTEDLTTEQLKKLMKAIGESSDLNAANLMRIAIYTGMRRGELFRLKWDDLNFRRGYISIVDPKGGEDQKIPLNKAARIVFKFMRKEGVYVFPGRGGKQRRDINKAVNRIKKAAGLPKNFRPLQGLRHSFASMLISSGKVDLYTLQKLLTHKSSTMTQRYAHLRDQTLKNASDLTLDLVNKAVSNNEDDA